MSDSVVGIIGATVAIGQYIVNDYVITIAEAEGDYGYTMTITRGTDTQTVTLYGLTPEQYASMLGYLEQAQAAAQSAAGSANDAADYMGVALDAANRANTQAGRAEQSSNTAKSYATQAQTAKQGAETAKTDAQTARTQAQGYRQAAEAAANRAETAAGQITGMTAEAETLTPGSPATASFLDGVLSLGIPAGANGADGNGIVSIVKTGTSGNVDTYTITYTNGTTSTFTVTNGVDGAVTSVAGKTGAVTLDAGDVAFDDQQTYDDGTVGAGLTNLKSQMENMPQPDWNQPDSSADDYIKNKPAIRQQANGGGILENGATSASGQNSHAEGGGTTASGAYSHAEGGGTTSSGQGSHAEGSGAEATGNYSHAEGGGTKAIGEYSHAEGAGAKAIGAGAHAEGSGTTASSSSSHAEGESTTASGGGAHSEGGGTTASGNASHAEGGSTTASGRSSHAEGGGTVASGDYSHAEGSNTTANHMAQHVFGIHNVPDNSTESSGAKGNYVEIVGNGLDVNRRSNARTLDWEGNEEVAGDIIAYGCGGANPISLADLKSMTDALKDRVSAIEEAEGLRRYGVSGIGQSASALTRLWDAVGMIAQVGTDGDNSNVVNSFDNVIPFNRRKCVGDWTLVEGRPVFHVHAYYGDEDYTEDGSMGDYVAVECPRAYYYLKDGVLGVSAHQWQGWRPFDIFCRGHNPEDTIPYVYLPAYALALKDGKAVSLPGLDNLQGTYKAIMDGCRTYGGGSLGGEAFCQPMAVNFYEWALYTVEFAQQNCQSIMYGCANLRHNADDRATLRSDGTWLLSNYQAGRVVGEYISIQDTGVDINSAAYYASHRITALTRCDAEGNASASGAYQLMETEDLGVDRTYEVGTAYRIAARPYRTGACSGVSTPSGSPVSNSDGYYPMKYRWRENVFANQYKTVADLFNKRVGTDSEDYSLEWYYLPDPANYTPSTSSKPDATDLATDAFILLDVETAHANYVNGYIKSVKCSEEYPDIRIPFEATGGSASTFYADYASLVNSYVVRAVRLGGNWNNGANDGFSNFAATNAPSTGHAHYGGDLFINQWGVNAA